MLRKMQEPPPSAIINAHMVLLIASEIIQYSFFPEPPNISLVLFISSTVVTPPILHLIFYATFYIPYLCV